MPPPVIGGLVISLAVLAANLAGVEAKMDPKVVAKWWTWLVTTELDWAKGPKLDVFRPFQVAFFTCIGLNASWALAKRGGMLAIIFLIAASVFAVLQNVVGVGMAKLLGVQPLLGVVCGAVTLTGGHSTAMGFAGELEKAGLKSAAEIGIAAATFGLVAGGLMGGALGGALIKKFKLQPSVKKDVHLEAGSNENAGILGDFRAMVRSRSWIPHLILLLVCIKVGAWVSYFIQQQMIPMPSFAGGSFEFKSQNVSFPIYMGAMLLGVFIRNIHDAMGLRWISTETVDILGSISLAIFLSIAMMSLNLRDLASVATPMLVILAVQVVVMALFAWFVIFNLMGRDYDAAVMSGGHCGFGMGATSNAIASMKTLVENYGPAPRAFLIIPVVGAFLIDFPNALIITVFINLFK